MAQPERLVWRSELGWSSRSPAGYANPQRGLVIHYDGSNQRLTDKSHSACIAYWNSTRRYHTGGNGWRDIGYSFGACPHGYVMEGRGLYRAQAAQPGGNTTYYSCTVMGGPSDEIPAAQIEAVRQLRAWLMEPDTSIAGTVKGHRDFISTSCPGNAAYRLVTNGTFAKAPGSVVDTPGGGKPTGGTSTEGDDDMSLINLRKGDGEHNGKDSEVTSLQVLIRDGAGQELPQYGIDGEYGDETAEALRLARKSVGSRAEAGWGDGVGGWGYAQLMIAVSRNQD